MLGVWFFVRGGGGIGGGVGVVGFLFVLLLSDAIHSI